MNLTNLFQPKSIALIGASNTADKLGNYIANNLVQSGYGGSLYFLNPKKEYIAGIDSLQEPLQIQEHVDLWVIAIPAHLVIASVLEITKQMQAVPSSRETFITIISAGFKEAGTEGMAMEAELILLSRQYNFQIIGPNCLGIINNQPNSIYKYNASFAVAPKLFGDISLVSQSGAIISGLVDKLEQNGVGFNKIISLGNQAYLEAHDFLEFLVADENTKIIALYIEGFTNATRFLEIAKTSNKPIIILKSGNSEASQKAITSHTGSIAGNSKTAKAYLESAGCILVDDLQEFSDTLLLFSKWN